MVFRVNMFAERSNAAHGVLRSLTNLVRRFTIQHVNPLRSANLCLAHFTRPTNTTNPFTPTQVFQCASDTGVPNATNNARLKRIGDKSNEATVMDESRNHASQG